MELFKVFLELVRLVFLAVAPVIGALVGVVVGSLLADRREAQRRRRLSRPVGALFREEIEQLVDFFDQGVPRPSKQTPTTPTHSEHASQLVELFEQNTVLAISRFYRALSTLEAARNEERELFDGLEGPGVSERRQKQAALVEQRVNDLLLLGQHAIDHLR